MIDIEQIASKYQLGTRDIYAHKDGWKIISADGIRKIIRLESIGISKDLSHLSADGKTAVVKCRAQKSEYLYYESLGEASPDNNTFKYPVNVAEKRAEGRAVLNVLDLYSDGFRSEAEIDEAVEGAKILAKRQEQTRLAIEETQSKLQQRPQSKKSLKVNSAHGFTEGAELT